MRYIQKDFTTTAVAVHNAELLSQHLDEASLSHRKNTEQLSGDDLYRKIRSTQYIPHFADIRNQLNSEQGGVCCYCGARLYYPDTQHYSVEHVNPRSLYPELVGEYKNMLLSCHSSESERHDIKTNVRRKKDRMSYYHCDESKQDSMLNYTPLQQSCETHFTYKLNGEVVGDNEFSKTDINTLNLNCLSLKNRRRELMLLALYGEEELLPIDILKQYKEKLTKRDEQENYPEFYFVLTNLISQII